MAKRRRSFGKPILTVSAAAVLASCGGAVSGNLVAPPMVELCVIATPTTATVSINGVEAECLHVEPCTTVTVTAAAEGFQDYEDQVIDTCSPQTVSIEMVEKPHDDTDDSDTD
jgi:hypothetical protein